MRTVVHCYINTQGGQIIRIFGKKTSEAEIRSGLPTVFPRLWRYALVLTASTDTANDLAQATCLRALEQHDKYLAGTQLDRWLFRMAHRIWLNELRSATVRRGGGLHPVETVEIMDPQLDAETNYFVQQVLSSIYILPEGQRACVMLVYVEGFKYAQAADILNVPIGTVMSRLAAARKTVTHCMGDKGNMPG